MDLELNRQKRRAENDRRRKAPIVGPAAIGKRDLSSGRYDVEYPDGSQYNGLGVKVFTAQHQEGDTVLAIPRQDGKIALDGPKPRIPQPNILDDPCGNYLEGQLFYCPQAEEEIIEGWALGLEETGTLKRLYLIDLKTGKAYSVGNWPKKINACPIDNPSDPPPPPSPPPLEPEGGYQHVWRSPSTVFQDLGGCDRGFNPATGRVVPINQYVLVSILEQSSGRTWLYKVIDGNYFDANNNFVSFVAAWEVWVITESPTPPPFPTGPGRVLVGGAPQDPVLYPEGYVPMVGLPDTNLQYKTLVSCPLKPPTNPYIPPPRDPSRPPIDNTAKYHLSLDSQKRPIVRLSHTPKCKGEGYEVDNYFRLEYNAQQERQLKSYPGNTKMKDWRFDLPSFRCRDSLKDNTYVNFDTSRTYCWNAEATIPGSNGAPNYERPETITKNAQPVNIKITKAKLPESSCDLPTGPELKRKTIKAVYRGDVGPSTLKIVGVSGSQKIRQ